MWTGAGEPVLAKREQLERCDLALADARSRLDDAAELTRVFPADRKLDGLQAISLEIARLRRRRDRLSAELEAVEAEWAS